MFRVIPFQVDCLQVGLPDSETPGGTGYLGKEERAGEKKGRAEAGGGNTQKTKHKYEGIDLGAAPMLENC